MNACVMLPDQENSPASSVTSLTTENSIMEQGGRRRSCAGNKEEEHNSFDEWAAAKSADGVYFYNTRTKESCWQLPSSVNITGNISNGFRFLETKCIQEVHQTPPSVDSQRRQRDLQQHVKSVQSLTPVFDSLYDSPQYSSPEKSLDEGSTPFRSRIQFFCIFCGDVFQTTDYGEHLKRCMHQQSHCTKELISEVSRCLNFHDMAEGRPLTSKENIKLKVNSHKGNDFLPLPTPGKDLREGKIRNHHPYPNRDTSFTCPLCRKQMINERKEFNRHLRECISQVDLADIAVTAAIDRISNIHCPFCNNPPVSAGLSSHLERCCKKIAYNRKLCKLI